MSSLCKNPELCIFFLFSVITVGNSASHFLDMIMLISKVGMLIRSRIGVGCITLHRRSPTRGQRVLCPNPENCIHSIFIYCFG